MGLPWGLLCLSGDSSRGKEGWKHANERKGISYLMSRNSTSSVCVMGDGSFRFVRLAGRYQRREVVRRDYHRVLKGRGRCLDFMICD